MKHWIYSHKKTPIGRDYRGLIGSVSRPNLVFLPISLVSHDLTTQQK